MGGFGGEPDSGAPLSQILSLMLLQTPIQPVHLRAAGEVVRGKEPDIRHVCHFSFKEAQEQIAAC